MMTRHTTRDGFVSFVALMSGLLYAPGCSTPLFGEETATVPAGTEIAVSLQSRLSSESNHSGDPFEAETLEPIVVDGKTVIPAGAPVRGRLTRVADAGDFGDRAAMTLHFEELVDPKGRAHPLETKPIALVGKSNKKGDIEKVAGGGIAGALIGGITGGKDGAAIGAVIGAGAGTAVAFATDGGEIILRPGQELRLDVVEPVDLPVVAQNRPKGGK
jgi:hypothetical protein